MLLALPGGHACAGLWVSVWLSVCEFFQSSVSLLLLSLSVLNQYSPAFRGETPMGVFRREIADALIRAVGNRSDSILEAQAHRFLAAQLGGDIPIGNSFATRTNHGLRIRTAATYSIIDGRIVCDGFLAIWANNLVFHLVSFLATSNALYAP